MTVPSTLNTETVQKTADVAGIWTGTESDRLGPAQLTWDLKQFGKFVTGTAIMRPVDATDGSCASCHKFKDGSFTGNIMGNTLQILMYFSAGGQDATPACSITLSLEAANVAQSTITGTYSGSDPCEGVFDGTLSMTRKP